MAWTTPVAWCRPGHLTRAGREDRRRLEAAEARYDAVSAEQGQRQAWLEAHADTLVYREQLAASVAERRRELGVAAAITQPDHVVDLIGAVSSDNPAALQRWAAMAGHIEAYREEWGVEPQRLTERPRDLCQGRAWEAAVHAAQLLSEPPEPVVERGLDRGLGLELRKAAVAITSSPGGELDVHGRAEHVRAVEGALAPGCARP